MSKDNQSPLETAAQRAEGGEKTPAWKRALGFGVRYLLPLGLTILMVWYMFKKVNFSDMLSLIRHGANYWWILCAMGISVFSHIFRAARWRLQLRSLGIHPPFMALCCSIFGCYALNLVFPRLGEVWRCTYIAQRQKAPFTTVLGSMVADRLADTLSVLILTVMTFLIATDAINSFLAKYPVGQNLLSLAANPLFWGAIVVGGLLVLAGFYVWRDTRFVKKVSQWLSQLWRGFADVARMKGRGKFLLFTVCIWGCYFIQLYVAFFAFSFTRELCAQSSLAWGLVPCLVAFVLSSIGMAIPSNGGLGPWNIAVMFGLAIYGISDAQGTAFSMLQWSGQTVMLIALGILTMIYIATSSKKRVKE